MNPTIQAPQANSLSSLGTEKTKQPVFDISVIIVSYNTRDVTLGAVGAVLRYVGTTRVEVIVVDNNSSDGSVAACRAKYPQIRVVEAKHNGGYAWGNNIGISLARGRYVLVLNPDTLLHEETLSRAVEYMDKNQKVGLLGARALYENGVQQSTLFRFPSVRSVAWNIIVPNRTIRNSRSFGDQRYASMPRNIIMDVDVVAGCFMMARRSAIEKAGAMDDRFFMYSEETEWCWRMHQAGYLVRYHPEIKITHFGAISTGQTSPWKTVEITKGRILFLRLCRGPGIAWVATVLMLLGNLLRGVWFIPKMVTLSGRKQSAPWRAQTAFLLRAFFWQPRGQTAPQFKDVEQEALTK